MLFRGCVLGSYLLSIVQYAPGGLLNRKRNKMRGTSSVGEW